MTTQHIAQENWIWHGHALHFIASDRCGFRLGTEIGDYVVSTVGDYYPETLRQRTRVGADRYFETMVFRVSGRTDCGCPDIDGRELLMRGYNAAQEAQVGHMAVCEMVACGEVA